MSDEIRGFSIPFRIDPNTGGIAVQSGAEKLKENIIHILLTRVGERVMRRAYGGGVHDMLHDSNDDTLRALAQHQISQAIARWEPRVLLMGLDVAQENGELMIRLRYIVRRTRQAEIR
jgi:uncharacterized protein